MSNRILARALCALMVALGVASACDSEEPSTVPLELVSVAPAVVDPLGGSHLVVTGSGFATATLTRVTLGGIDAESFEVVSDSELRVVSPALAPAGGLDLAVFRGEISTTHPAAIEAWSPAQIQGARVFDAAVGVDTATSATRYEWQQLTDTIHPDWRIRDGNTTTYLPSTGRYWMVGGWNGYQVPVGFSTVPPDAVYPPENTTNEVWSSPDGVTWTLELPHGHGQFERRHVHNTMVWKDKLWLIGGDHHQGRYNHDVVSSPDGLNWTVELGPGTTSPPWSPRALQVSGVYDGKLWTVGGQDIVGDPETMVDHNDVWVTEDGVNWTQVVADAPASDTRWAGCGVLDGLVEFKGRMWLVGCAKHRDDAGGHLLSNEVWSTTDGATWKRHREPPWKGKIWHNVVVWDAKLWILFGYTYGDPSAGWAQGNANEVWFSSDGETWESLPVDSPVPGSHAQGVAVTADHLLMSGGNHSFDPTDGFGKSVWRLVPFRGEVVDTWTDRGADALVIAPPTPANRPLHVGDAFGPGRAGLHFDGSTSLFELAAGPDSQTAGRSVFWVARAPHRPVVPGRDDIYNPSGTIVGGAIEDGSPQAAVGLSHGEVLFVNREDGLDPVGAPLWTYIRGGDGLQPWVGAVHVAGITHATDGSTRVWVDGAPSGPVAQAFYGTSRGWSRIGGGIDGPGEGPANRFAGTLGAVIIAPAVLDEATLAKLQAWAVGRFGAAPLR